MSLSAPVVPDGQVYIYTTQFGGAGVYLVLAGAPQVTSTTGGWQQSARAGRAPATWWSGPDAPTGVQFDLAADARLQPKYQDVAKQIDDLTRLGAASDGNAQPPVLNVECNSTPFLDRVDLVMQGLTLGEQVFTDGALVRQEVAITLEAFQPFEPLTSVRPTASRSPSNHRRARVIEAKGGDTLRAIAVRQLGDASRWKDIRKWNKSLAKVDPDAPLRAGTKVTLR